MQDISGLRTYLPAGLSNVVGLCNSLVHINLLSVRGDERDGSLLGFKEPLLSESVIKLDLTPLGKGYGETLSHFSRNTASLR